MLKGGKHWPVYRVGGKISHRRRKQDIALPDNFASKIGSIIHTLHQIHYIFQGVFVFSQCGTVIAISVDTVFDGMLKIIVFASHLSRNVLKISYLYPMESEGKTERR
jgi:hypothetical protein